MRPSSLRPTRWIVPLLAAALGAACQAQAPQAEARPAAAPAPATPDAAAPATQPAATPSPAPAQQAAAPGSAEDWLQRIEERSKSTRTLVGDMRYDRVQGLLGDRQKRMGRLWYVAGPPAQFAVHLDRLFVDGRRIDQDKRYVFDGQWLVERDNDERIFSKRQVVAPDAPPERTNPLAIGEGPFVLPVGADRERILRRFDVSVVEAEEGDPPRAVHLRLIPKENQRIDFTQIDLWYDRETLLPLRAAAVDDSENESIVDLMNVRVNEEVDPALFDVSEPRERGWQIDVQPWEG